MRRTLKIENLQRSNEINKSNRVKKEASSEIRDLTTNENQNRKISYSFRSQKLKFTGTQRTVAEA